VSYLTLLDIKRREIEGHGVTVEPTGQYTKGASRTVIPFLSSRGRMEGVKDGGGGRALLSRPFMDWFGKNGL